MRYFCLIFAALLLFSTAAFGQLQTKSRGRVYDASNSKLSKREVRALLASNSTLLRSYNVGQMKRIAGDVMIGTGVGIAVGSYVATYVSDAKTSPITFVGLGLALAGIPVRIGYRKKVQSAIEGYNQQHSSTGYIPEFSLQANGNGIGLKYTF